MQIDNIHCRRGKNEVLNGCTCEFLAGQVTAILGPNGAGKSTLLECLAGIRVPDTGEVLLGGKSLSEWTPRELARRRAVMSQRSDLSFGFSVEEVVAFGRDPHGDAEAASGRQCIDQALGLADMCHLCKRSYLQLSGGEQQRVHFARAIAQVQPVGPGSVVLLDEPTSALDISHQEAVCQQARRLARDGCCVILVVHDLQLAARYADMLVLMHNGLIARRGSVDEVFEPRLLEKVYGCPFVVRDLGNEIGRVILPQAIVLN